ncbi:hypothetical protein ACWEO1_16810 [Kitasatospora cineracea]
MPTEPITPKQLAYLRSLIRDTGIGDEWLGAWAKPWLTQRERGVGRIENLAKPAASTLIDGLKAIKDRQAGS